MSAACENKRSNRKAKKKRSAQQMKENQVPKAAATSVKTESIAKTGLDATIPLSQVVNKSSFTPFLDGERCILCHQERPTTIQKADTSTSGVDIFPGAQQFVDKLPLWVCPECRERVEEDERKAGLDSVLNAVNTSEGVMNSFVPEEGPNKDLCNCHVCAGKRHLVPAKTKEIGELQFSWFEVKHFVRCVYRKAGTTLADDDKLMKTSLDIDRMKRHTEKLTSQDPYQLYERLEAQTREYLTEVRISLIKFFTSSFTNSLQHAKDCVMTLLDEYQSLCVAINMLKPFFQKLDSNFLKTFKWSWELMNKEAYKEEVFNDSVIQTNLPLHYERLLRGDKHASDPSDQCSSNSKSDLVLRFESLTWEVTDVDKFWQTSKPLQEKYCKEKHVHERVERENWDEPLKKMKQGKDEDVYGCEQCDFLSNHFTSPNDISNSLSSLKRSLSSSRFSSSAHSPNQYCSRHAQNGSTDDDDLSNTTQLLPTALFLNRLTNSKCASCIREALHSFCFDQNAPSATCHHHEEHDLSSSSLKKLPSCHSHEVFNNCDNHSSHDPFWYNHDTPPPETASSIQSLVLNGNSTGGNHCENHACCTKWEDNDEGDIEKYHEHGGCQEHRGALSPSIMIPGNNVDVEAPPSSPSSDRSVGDGSSCDTPTSRSSLSEDGRSNNGKFCDCCYCEFFGHGTPSLTPTSHNFVEMREKLRLRLKEKEKKAVYFQDYPKGLSCITDTRSVDELLTFINGEPDTENMKNKASSKAAKRQRQKQKKAAAKAVLSRKISCLLNIDEVNDERPPLVYEEEKLKKNTRQKKCEKSQGNRTERENAKNQKKTLANDVHDAANSQSLVRKPGENMVDKKPAPIKQETGNHVDKRKKNKGKKISGNKFEDNVEERRVIGSGEVSGTHDEHARGSGEVSGTHDEHARAMKLPVRDEVEPRHCGKERSVHETESQGKKTKSRKKKKAQYLDDVFLPKENLTNGHSGEVDEAEREVEEFKRFCASAAPVTRRLKLPANVNLKNLNLGLRKS